MIDPQIRLSSTGLRKREQILALALRASSRRRQHRMVVRCAVGCAVIAGALSLLLRIDRGVPSAPNHVRAFDPVPSLPSPDPAHAPVPVRRTHEVHEIVITRLRTDPQAIRELAVRPASQSVERIGDDQLLEELALAHKPAGLARVGGKALLLFRDTPHVIHHPE